MFNLQFFGEERTEEATPHKREKVREEGRVCVSKDLNAAVAIITALLGLAMLGTLTQDDTSRRMVCVCLVGGGKTLLRCVAAFGGTRSSVLDVYGDCAGRFCDDGGAFRASFRQAEPLHRHEEDNIYAFLRRTAEGFTQSLDLCGNDLYGDTELSSCVIKDYADAVDSGSRAILGYAVDAGYEARTYALSDGVCGLFLSKMGL